MFQVDSLKKKLYYRFLSSELLVSGVLVCLSVKKKCQKIVKNPLTEEFQHRAGEYIPKQTDFNVRLGRLLNSSLDILLRQYVGIVCLQVSYRKKKSLSRE